MSPRKAKDGTLSERELAQFRHTQSNAELELLIRKLRFLRSLDRAPVPSELDSADTSLKRLRKIVSR